MNAKDFFNSLELAECHIQVGPVKLSFAEDKEYDNLIVKYNDVFFIIMYQIDGGSIKEAMALTERDIYPSNTLDSKIVDFERYARQEGVFIERKFDQDFSENSEENYFLKIIKKSIYGGNYAWVNLIKDPIDALKGLYGVLQRSVEFFKSGKPDKTPKIIRS